MKTTVTHPSDTTVSVAITVDADELAAAEQVALTKLARTMRVQGFRTGKVPVSVAQKHVDPNALQQETLENALSKAVSETFLNEKLQALDRPSVEVKKFVPREQLEFTAEAEVLPKVTLGDYKTLTVESKKSTVKAADVNDIVERMRSNFAEREEVDRAAKDGDETVIDFVGKKDGVAFDGGTSTDYALTLGSNTFIPGFEDGIVGKTPGETFDIALKFPDEYHSDELRGADVTFTVTLKTIKQVTLPEVNDDFAAKCGPFKTVAELKADIKRELTAQKEREDAEQRKDELVQQLVDVSKVPVPNILLEDQKRSIERDFEQNLMYQGLTVDAYLAQRKQTKDEWLAGEVSETAEKRVKAGLVLAELSKVEKISSTNEELSARIAEMRQQYPSDSAATQLDTPEAQRDMANRILTEKTIERLVELNT